MLINNDLGQRRQQSVSNVPRKCPFAANVHHGSLFANSGSGNLLACPASPRLCWARITVGQKENAMLVQHPLLAMLLLAAFASSGFAQAYGEPDRGEPGDAMIQEYLRHAVDGIESRALEHATTLDEWQSQRPRLREEYLSMLGLAPLPERTNLNATITHTLHGDGFIVDCLHYQSRPQLYVTANLYRPAKIVEGEKLPAVLYVCGHSGMGRNGNKTAFQSHGVWFARHGYVCLVVDTLQLGEIAAIHHGTYRENRWWWHSRGYTSAGVECWNGVRGIDYLTSRADVDPKKIAVTGISGGGAATFWIAAADDRVRVAVPVSGMADLESYVSNCVINGHCDCMFLHNAAAWPWTRIAALVTPRPLLFVNSDRDPIFPMDANERIVNRLERVYSLYGASGDVDSVVSVGGHDYRRDIRQAVFRFINSHLKGDASAVLDSEEAEPGGTVKLFKPEELRALATDDDLPKDQRNTTIDQHFVPLAKVEPPASGEFADWQKKLLSELRNAAFRYFPAEILAATVVEQRDDQTLLETEQGIRVPLMRLAESAADDDAKRRVLIVAGDDARTASVGEVAVARW